MKKEKVSENQKKETCDTSLNLWWPGVPPRDRREGGMNLAYRLNRKAEVDGRRLLVLGNSMNDWLDEDIPVEWLRDLLNLIRCTPQIDWILLTKRPEKFRERLQKAMGGFAPNCCTAQEAALHSWLVNMRDGWLGVCCVVGRENYWIGTSCEDQQQADERLPALLEIPATVRFVMCEPLPEEWAVSLRDQSLSAGVLFFVGRIAGSRSRILIDLNKKP